MLASLQTAAAIAQEMEKNEIFVNYRVCNLLREREKGCQINRLQVQQAYESEEGEQLFCAEKLNSSTLRLIFDRSYY